MATMRDYQSKVNAYTRGHGRLSCILKGYEPCHNTEEVMESIHYDPEADLANPTGSVFCAHGAGFVVNWDMVDSYAHVESGWKLKEEKEEGSFLQEAGNSQEEIGFLAKSASENRAKEQKNRTSEYISQEEIEEIFRKTYGKTKEDPKHYRRFHRGNRREYSFGADSGSTHQTSFQFKKEKQEEYFLVDGYNIIFAWQELRELAQVNIDSARDKLMDILCNYQGYLGCTMILVFDAYKVKGNPGSVQKYHNIYVVYTKEAETADQYIEKTVHKIAKKSHVTVATSDALEQMIIWGSGALRMSAQGLKEAVENAQKTLREEYHV